MLGPGDPSRKSLVDPHFLAPESERFDMDPERPLVGVAGGPMGVPWRAVRSGPVLERACAWCAWVGEGEGAGLEWEERPSEWSEPVLWYMLAAERRL